MQNLHPSNTPTILAPSILSADFANLGGIVSKLDMSQAQYIHIDVMDGLFVPNLTFGFPVIKAIRKYSKKVFDVHLMIEKPERYIQEFKEAGADILTVHIEASTHLHRTLQNIHNHGMKRGVALNPHTPISSLDDIIQEVDLVCLMSVNPGYGGQKFIENTYRKTSELRDLISKRNSSALIEIDGGVSLENTKALIDAGANVLVAGNNVFSAENFSQNIEAFHKLF